MSDDRETTTAIVNGEIVILVPVPSDFPERCGDGGHVFWEPDRCACGRFFDVRPRYRRLPVAFGPDPRVAPSPREETPEL